MRKAMADAGLPEPEFDPNGFFTAIFRRSPEFALKQAGLKTRVDTRVKPRVKTGVRIVEMIRTIPR